MLVCCPVRPDVDVLTDNLLAEGRQSVDGTWGLDRDLPEELP